MVARDIPAGIGTTGRVRPDGFVRGVIDTPRDYDWYRVDLDPGRYVIRLSGVGDRPVGDTLLVLRDENGTETDRNDDYYSDMGESRVEIEVTGGRETWYLDVSGLGPYPDPTGPVGRATGDFVLAVNRLAGSPVDAVAGSAWFEKRVIDVWFAPRGATGDIRDGTVTTESAGWSDYQVRRALAALDTYADVCDVDFRQAHRRANADLNVLLYGGPDNPGGGLFQAPGTIGEGTGVFAGGATAIANNNWAVRPGGGLERGAPGWELLVHEFGHALGLAHPHDRGLGSAVMAGIRPPDDDGSYPLQPGDFGLNSNRFTVMSYRGSGIDEGTSRAYGYAMGPMAFDIAALQQMYGATRSHHRDDVYVLPDRNVTGTGYLCIWDTGGVDTIRAGRTDRNCTIDLNDATLAYEPGGGGFLSSARGVLGGFTIANGVRLENATGGNGNDSLVGNEFANRLDGGAGADRIRGAGGADRLHAGDDDARDVFVYRARSDSGRAIARADRIGGFDARDGRRETVWDRIDLSGLDGDAAARGDQPLRFVRAFSTPDAGEPPGQVLAGRQRGDVHVLIDLDGDNAADMRIVVRDVAGLGVDDFLL